MKIDFAQVLKNIDGSVLIASADAPPLTLASVVQSGLLSVQQEDNSASGEHKARLYRLAIAISPAVLEFPVEDVAIMKHRIVAGYGPLVVGQAWAMLDEGVAT